MHPALLYTARYGPQIAAWLFANRDQFAGTFDRFAAPVVETLSGGPQSIDRIGSVLTAQREGHREVIGLLHRQEVKIDGVGKAVDGVADAVQGLAAGQASIAATLGVLTSLSAVTLGFSVLTPAILLAQFRVLKGRLDRLSSEVKAIQERLDLKSAADLDAGLTFLGHAGEGGPDRDATWTQAYAELTMSEKY